MTGIISVGLFAAWRTLSPQAHVREWAVGFAVLALAILGRALFIDHAGQALPVADLTVELLGLATTVLLAQGFASRSGDPGFLKRSWPLWLAAGVVIGVLRAATAGLVADAAAAIAQAAALVIAAALAARRLRGSGLAELLALSVLVLVAAGRLFAAHAMFVAYLWPVPHASHAWVPAIMIEPSCIGLVMMFLIASDLSLELNRLACTDPLTGIMNLAGFEDAAKRAIARARFPDRPLSIAIADIDRFKAINDAHGHAAGDVALSRFAGAIAGALGGDKVGRIGGEEFGLLLPGQDAYCALARLDRLRGIETEVPAGDGIGLTASFGIAELAPGETLTALLARADRALYRSKAAGRNRCTLAPVMLSD